MLVTIITVAFNSEATIRKTIESVLGQTYDEIEYLVIDGLSQDGTVAIAESYKQAFIQKGYRYRVISEPDTGMYDALNKGAKLANGKIVGQINSDDWYEPDAVATMVRLYDDSQYDVAWGSIRVCGKSSWIKHACIGRLWTTSGWCHPAMFSRHEILLEYPYAQESMYDDFDYVTSVYVAGKKIVTIDKVISNFTFGAGGQSTQKSLTEVKRRVDITYHIYRKHGMSRVYYLYRWGYELLKYLFG